MLEGISIYDKDNLLLEATVPPIYIDEFLVDDKPVNFHKDKIELPHTVQNLVFRYHSKTLNPAYRLRYTVKLENFNKDWSKPRSERYAQYSYLKPGDYEFKVCAITRPGNISNKPATIKFRIVPPLWRNWWFILLVTVVSVGFITAVITFRIKKLQREKELLYEAVRERTMELEEKNRELESFAYTVSHDLKDPIGVIVGYAQVMEDFCTKRKISGASQFLEGIKRNANKIVVFIDDLLQLSRSGKVIEKLTPTDINIIVRQIRKEFMEKKGLKEKFLEIDDLPIIMVDADRLYMVFQNLISNAYKYRNKEKPLRIKVSYERKGDYHQFMVQDNGIGIKKEDIDKIFQPGVRLKVVDTSGTGFGLRIVKKIVEAHDGEIWVESKYGKGTTFYFTIKAFERP